MIYIVVIFATLFSSYIHHTKSFLWKEPAIKYAEEYKIQKMFQVNAVFEMDLTNSTPTVKLIYTYPNKETIKRLKKKVK